MTETPVRRRPGGRSAAVRRSVLDAVIQAVADDGPDALTIAGIAAAAGVHETTVYRRWGSAEQLLLDAMLDYSEDRIEAADLGSLREDLVDFALAIAGFLSSATGRALARAMIGTGAEAPVPAGRAEFWQRRFAVTEVIFRRAAERGEWPEDADAADVLETIVARTHFRLLLLGRPVGRDEAQRSVDDALAAVV
ncbi:TetR-like C-terminal domain-containing protein [Mycetocola reblochoni]|uniref:TetR family transcriptional regulator n=1 Tax=Mycetocola reblochoni TaxID=331618 RepID=A0A3L6ZNY6_9MICO|nr:TetR-like C-terminal domain-containing protein [Mycetocola reblochoni]RLP69696.1 TetR family transcriptional regulator [Mycetocola reblochoni]